MTPLSRPSMKAWLTMFAALAVSACATRPPSAPEMTAQGDVGYQVIPPASEGKHPIQRGQAAHGGQAHDDHVVLPVYPPQWLAQRLETVIADALIVVDVKGHPERIDIDTAALITQCNDCADAFGDSVETALKQWTFAPLEIVDWIDGPDEDGDGEPDSVTRGTVDTRPYSLRLRFSFSVRDGEGVVSQSE